MGVNIDGHVGLSEADVIALIAEYGSEGGLLHSVVVEVGPWNMVSLGSKGVAHGQDLSKIMGISVVICDDSDSVHRSLHESTNADEGYFYCDSTYVEMTRGGIFNSVAYDDEVMNRGFIVLWLID
ncbi:MAG TPA: hypothetical protein VMV77_02245 [Bacteroidales bacterium]|nr:hypothetical protein [Bacteroidales bacterium]